MAETYRHLGEADAAEAFFHQSLQMACELGLRPEQAHCQSGLALVLRRSGRGEEAREFAKAASKLYAALEMPAASPEYP